MTLFPQIDCFFRYIVYTGWFVSDNLKVLVPRPPPARARLTRFGVCGEVFSQQLRRAKLIMPGKQLVNKSFPFRKSTYNVCERQSDREAFF